MLDKLIHKTLKVPYRLNFSHRLVKGSAISLVLIHGLGASENMWHDLIERLPKDLDIITVDLIGFGSSPQPEWDAYDLETQARAVRNTLVWARARKQIIVCGHSLGSLVGIEMAALYPSLINQLILCSPPIYKRPIGRSKSSLYTKGLKRFYHDVINNQGPIGSVIELASKHGLIYEGFDVNEKTMPAFFETLQTAIINQDSYSHLQALKLPTKIIYGLLDPLLVTENFKLAAQQNSVITLIKVPASHHILGFFEVKLTDVIIESIAKITKTATIKIK